MLRDVPEEVFDLHELASTARTLALGMREEDGVLAPILFLRLPSGEMEIGIFETGDVTGERIARAVAEVSAEAVVLVGEAWKAAPEDVPPGGRARDSPTAEDAVLVAGLDSSGTQVVLDGAPGDTGSLDHPAPSSTEFTVGLFDETRELWKLPRQVELPTGPVSLEVPWGWRVQRDGRVTRIVSPDATSAVNASIYARSGAAEVGESEAYDLAVRFTDTAIDAEAEVQTRPEVSIDQTREGSWRVATTSFTVIGQASRHRWDLRVIVTPEHAVILTYDDEGADSDDDNRLAAARMLASAVVFASKPESPPPSSRPPWRRRAARWLR